MHRTKLLQRLALVLALTVFPSLRADEPPLLLEGGRVITQGDSGVLPQADILIVDGKIAAVGKDLEAPQDARRIDISGLTVAPGLIDARSTLWLTSASAGQGASDGSLNALDGVDWYSQDWREPARQGVTSAGVQPAASGNLGGLTAVLRVAEVDDLSALVLKPEAAVQAALGMGARSGTSRERSAQYTRIQAAFTAAEKYQEAWKKWEEYEKERAEAKEKEDDKGKDKPKEGEAEKAKAKQATPGPATGRGRGQRGQFPPGGRGGRGGRGGPPGRGMPGRGAPSKEASKDDDAKTEDAKDQTRIRIRTKRSRRKNRTGTPSKTSW